ncbi:MAG: hypothetical protein HY696_12300 [Deltaproteobacteria bacterium]|nr:hypothetical protein [Deltaproteobacteria bacterium]
MGRSVTAAANVRPRPTQRLDRARKGDLSQAALHRDVRLMDAHRRKLVRDRERLQTAVNQYWRGESGWGATKWQLLEARAPTLTKQVHAAKRKVDDRDAVRAALNQQYGDALNQLNDTVAWAERLAIAAYAEGGEGTTKDPSASYLARLEHGRGLRLVRWQERAMLDHPWPVYVTEAMATYPLLDALLTEQLGHGLDGWGRPAALTAFVGLHATIFPKVLAWLDGIADLEARFWKRVLVVAPIWAAIYVLFYQAGTHGLDGISWQEAAKQVGLALGGTAVLSPLEWYITNQARYEERYFLTILRSVIWSAGFSVGAALL